MKKIIYVVAISAMGLSQPIQAQTRPGVSNAPTGISITIVSDGGVTYRASYTNPKNNKPLPSPKMGQPGRLGVHVLRRENTPLRSQGNPTYADMVISRINEQRPHIGLGQAALTANVSGTSLKIDTWGLGNRQQHDSINHGAYSNHCRIFIRRDGWDLEPTIVTAAIDDPRTLDGKKLATGIYSIKWHNEYERTKSYKTNKYWVVGEYFDDPVRCDQTHRLSAETESQQRAAKIYNISTTGQQILAAVVVVKEGAAIIAGVSPEPSTKTIALGALALSLGVLAATSDYYQGELDARRSMDSDDIATFESLIRSNLDNPQPVYADNRVLRLARRYESQNKRSFAPIMKASNVVLREIKHYVDQNYWSEQYDERGFKDVALKKQNLIANLTVEPYYTLVRNPSYYSSN